MNRELREAVCKANRALLSSGLVTMHSGNASGVDRETGTVYIKPSGVDYESLVPEQIVAVDLASGVPHEGQLKPSVDLPHHLYLYRHMEDVGAVVHTHSNYATAFAALHRPIPLVLTAIADEFGGEIPCAPYIDNQGDHIGQAIVRWRGRGPAILLGNHGVFAWGDTVHAALKAAIMTEDVAKTVHLALQLGQPLPIPPEEAAKWHARYLTTYGQRDP